MQASSRLIFTATKCPAEGRVEDSASPRGAAGTSGHHGKQKVKIGLGLGPSSLAAILATLGGTPLAAETASGTMAVTATVLPTCNVKAGAMTFGTVAGDEPAASAQTVLTLDCTPGTPYAVTLDEGLQGGRRMIDQRGAAFLDYEIFQDAAQTRRWGGTAADGVSGVAPSGGTVSLSAYGRVVSRTATPGQYGDVVTVAVQF